MMDDMIERVARAILDADLTFRGSEPISDGEWRNYWSPGGPTALPSLIAMRARAAIEAMHGVRIDGESVTEVKGCRVWPLSPADSMEGKG